MATSKKTGKFIRVKCSKCKNSQVMFGKASTKIRCNECNGIIGIPSGGNAKVRARVEEIL
jgi:ribosomal protein S27E